MLEPRCGCLADFTGARGVMAEDGRVDFDGSVQVLAEIIAIGGSVEERYWDLLREHMHDWTIDGSALHKEVNVDRLFCREHIILLRAIRGHCGGCCCWSSVGVDKRKRMRWER